MRYFTFSRRQQRGLPQISSPLMRDKNMKETDDWSEMTTFMYEELRAFKRAAITLKLTKNDVADVMCGNAADLFNIKF